MSRHFYWAILGLLTLGGVLGCASKANVPPLAEPFKRCEKGALDPAAQGIQVTCPAGTNVEQDIFVAKCAGSGCHSAVGAQLGLDLVTPGIAERTVGAKSKRSGCEHRVLVDPANPDCSMMLESLTENPECGDPMPFGRGYLTTEEFQCVRDWIIRGGKFP